MRQRLNGGKSKKEEEKKGPKIDSHQLVTHSLYLTKPRFHDTGDISDKYPSTSPF